jgi:ribosomal-protein-alanine N-acetyltransferase
MLDRNIVIKGIKTTIRPFMESDINEDYISWLNDDEIMKFSNQRFITHDRKSSLNYINGFIDTSNAFFAVEDIETSKLIGTITVYFSEREGIADLGILLGDKESAGKGFGKDCWCAMVELLKKQDNVRKITAGTVSVNKPMLALMHAANMLEDGRRRKQQIIKGHPVDVLYFALFPNV